MGRKRRVFGAAFTHRLEEQGFAVTHIDNGPNTSIFWARRQPC